MINNSMIDKLSKQANVSYADAREALEMTDWEVLDAYVWLEAQGKIDSAAAQSEAATQAAPAQEQNPAPEQAPVCQEKQSRKTRGFFSSLLHMMQNNFFCIHMKDGYTRRLSLLAALVITLIFRKLVLLLIVIGLICGVKFSFEGPDMQRKQKNNS